MPTLVNQYDMYLDTNPANYVPLSPLSFLRRAADTARNRTAIIYGESKWTWGEVEQRCRSFASALQRRGIGKGDTVGLLARNIPAAVEAHFSVPMTGAVLNMLNVRLDADGLAFLLEHAGTKVVLVDPEFMTLARSALKRLPSPPQLIYIDDPFVSAARTGEPSYDDLICEGDPGFEWSFPGDEWDAITLTYTSGTTGNPKGVVYHHRGAYLNAIGNVLATSMERFPVLLWTLPLSHCNGWCFPWTVTMQSGTHVCLRDVSADSIYEAIDKHGINYFCGAPTIMNMIVSAPRAGQGPLKRPVVMITGGSAPTPTLIEKVEALGIELIHVYGLTEVYGPATVCAASDEQLGESEGLRAQLRARQGLLYQVEEDLLVGDPETLMPVPRDGHSIGEVFIRGNTVMKGYLKNPSATEEAFRDGWFHTGDLAVWYPDGHIEIKDRSKDIIILGSEHISTIEVERAFYRHPDVQEVAVVRRPDDVDGETPVAFVTLVDGSSITEQELIVFCHNYLAEFKMPKAVVFGPLPKSAAGKVMKYMLRERAIELANVSNGVGIR